MSEGRADASVKARTPASTGNVRPSSARTGSVRTGSVRGQFWDRSSLVGSAGSGSALPALSTGRALGRPQVSQSADLSVLELPLLVAKVGPQVVAGESVWMEGPGLVAAALGADIPLRAAKPPQLVSTGSTEQNVPVQLHMETDGTRTETERRTKPGPLSGVEVFEMLVKQRNSDEMQFFYLKAAEDGPYRPYDLQVVPCSKAGSDHHVFSAAAALQVQGGRSAELVTPAEWYREAVLWSALREIPFFRLFLLQKAFTRWRRGVCRVVFGRRRKLLESRLLMAVPQFREALLHFSRLLEELKSVQWLPQDESRTFTLQEFQTSLLNITQESQRSLLRFLQYRSLILTTVQESCFKAQQELQRQVEQSRLRHPRQPLHQQHALRLGTELNRAQHALHRLGNITALIDHMTVQNLTTITQRETTTLLTTLLQRDAAWQGGLFQVELVLGEDGQITVVPPIHSFWQVLSEALLSVRDSILQVFDSFSNSAESSIAGVLLTNQHPSSSTDLPSNMSCPISRASRDRGSTQACPDSLSSLKKLSGPSASDLLLPTPPSLRAEVQWVRGQCQALSREQLEWHLQLYAVTQEIHTQQTTTITQEAVQEVQQWCERCSWLEDALKFAKQWSTASVESMGGWPASQYRQHIQQAQHWRERVGTMPAAFTTTNQLLTVTSSHIQQQLWSVLTSIQRNAVTVLCGELQQRSENLTSDLIQAVQRLESQPSTFSDFTRHASMVNLYRERSADLKQQLDSLYCLQEITTQLPHSDKTPGEHPSMEQNLNLWNQFVLLLEQAADTVTNQLPTLMTTLDSTFSSLTTELQDLVHRANTGPYTDPTQSAGPINSELRVLCTQINVIEAQMDELSLASQTLTGNPLDLISVRKAKQAVEVRKELWDLITESAAQIQRWRLQQFSKFMVVRAQEKVSKWLQQAASISSVIPAQDLVLLEAKQNLDQFSRQLSVLAQLSSPTLKPTHWRNICAELDLFYSPELNFTVSDLLSTELLKHEGVISKICREAEAAAELEQAFRSIQQSWEQKEFRLERFIFTVWMNKDSQLGVTPQKKTTSDCDFTHNPPQLHICDSRTFIITDLDTLLYHAEDSTMTLSCMLRSRYALEFRTEVELWLQVLQELVELLDICERYQQKWIFLSKIFNQTSERTPKQLMEKFSSVDKTFREIIQFILIDPHVLNFVRLWKTTETCSQFQGRNLHVLFTEGLTVLEEVCSELMDLVDSVRGEFPRLQFLSDEEVMKILSLHPTPSSLLSLVRKCFRGVQGLEVTNSSGNDVMGQTESNDFDLFRPAMWVQGVYGALQEHLPFHTCPLEPAVDPLIWLGLLENRLYQTVKQLMHRCVLARQCQKKLERNGVPSPEVSEQPAFWQEAAEYPVQCCLVAEEILWCSEVEKAFQDPDRSIRKSLKSRNATKLKSLCQAMQDIFANLCDGSLATKHALTALQALILLTMKHSQQIDDIAEVKGSLESSFKWQRTMTYHHSATDNCNQSGLSQEDPSCTEHSVYVNILGMQLPYGYEYIGPENWMAVTTSSTERAFLGIVFALSCYRCAYISGPSMSGKKETALQLGWALGRQVVTLRIFASTSLPVVCQMLIGALQTGAWLVLDSVESMDQGSLSVLGQHLTDLHQHLSMVQSPQQLKKVQQLQDPNDLALPEQKPWCQKTAEMKCQVPFAGSNISVKLSFGCVLISSNGYSAEIPENLRVVTRPVSLMHPDYRIITEVLILSLGFSEAVSLSRRLVSLFSLAKDLFCLPDYVYRDQTSWLVLLKRVIHASGLYLYNYFEKNKVVRFVQPVQDGQRSENDPTLRCQGSDRIPQGSEDHCSGHYQCFGRDFVVNAVREEQYVVKAVAVVVLPAITEPSRALRFQDIFEEIFPTGRSFTILQKYVKEREQDLLRNAVSEELQETGLWPDSPMLDSALTLYETLKLSKVVMLLGPAGSGKTTLYQALAGALRRLAAKSISELDEEDDHANKTKTKVSSGSHWYSVNTVVLFPNALPHEELFGKCYRQHGCWCDGAITKVIRTSGERDSLVNDLSKANDRKAKKPNAQWLVLDGDPSSQPGWFYFLRTLGDFRDPCLCLSSSEKVQPSQELKIIIENTSLRDAAPSTLAQCSLVNVSGHDLWKAIWKNELDALYRDDALDRSTLKMWKSAADDLFSRTLSFIKHHSLTTVLSGEGDEGSGIIDGLREITSFINILHALLEGFDDGCGLKSSTEKGDSGQGPIFTQLQARNLFMIAYVWGFGGHLHHRHWPKFDLLAREALFESRYKIEVPAEDTVFDHFFNLRDRRVDDAPSTASFTRNPQHSYTPVPQYEKHAYLLDRVLEAGRPALLVGESASGKTLLCRFLSQRRPSLNLSVSPPLHGANLRYILEHVARHQTGLHPAGTIAQRPTLLLFVDDLHEAPCDNNGTSSMVLETLRQCISQGGVRTSHGYHFRSFSSGALNYLAAYSTFRTDQTNPSTISPRFSRLFTLLVLPDVTPEVLFSIHSTQLLPWLQRFPCMPAVSDLARCIVTATFDVYAAVREHLYDSTDAHCPYTWFSLHDIQKVFQGMCLWYPMNSAHLLLTRKSSISSRTLPAFTQADLHPAATVLNIAHLWMHECLRTFGDRLSSDEEIQNLLSILTRVSEKRYGRRLVEIESQTSKANKSDSTGQLKEINEDHQNQLSQQSQPSQQSQRSTETTNMEESVASKESPIEEVIKTHFKSSVEQSASNSRFPKIDSEEDDSSVGSSSKESKSEMSGHSIADDQPESVLNESAPQDFTLSKSEQSESALNCMDNSSSDEAKRFKDSKLDQCDFPTCEDHFQNQDHSRSLLKLLVEMGSTIGSAVYSPDLRKPVEWIKQKHQHSYQERDLDILIQQLNQIVNQKQEKNDLNSTFFAVYPKRVHHLVRILRALLLPGGHGVLLAAGRKTGRKTTVRLASRLAGHRLIEIHHGNEAKLSEILRETRSQTGVNGGPAVVLVHEDVSQAIRDKLMVMMANKAVPDVPEEVYSDELMKDVMLNSTAMKNSSKPRKSAKVFKRCFRNRRINLHIFLLLSFNERQPGLSPVTVPHMTRLFSLCSCVDVYQPWSSDILTQIASQYLQQHLQNLPSDIQGEGVVCRLAEVMAGVHLSALHCASTSSNVQLFGPKNYFELMRHFHHLYAHLTEQGRVPATRLESVLARVRGVAESAQKLREELLTLQDKYDEIQEVVKQLQESADAEHVQCDEAHRHRLLAEAQLWDLEEQLERVEKQIRRSMSEAGPLYQAALNALRSLNQSDLEEVRSYRLPPAGVVTLMNAVCMLFHQPCSWESSKLLLNQSEFIQELEFFDRSSLSNEVFDKLGEVVRSPELQPESVRAVSRACESLSCWLQAVYQCAMVQRLMVPLEAQKSRLWKSAAESRARLREARMQEEAARDQLEVTERQQRMVRTSLEHLAEQIHEVQAREKEAVAAVHQISYYTEKWSFLQQETEMNNRTVPGDALILAAAIVYLGPFGPDVRLDLLEKWHRMCLKGGRSAGPDHPPGSLPDGAQCGSAQNSGFVPVPVGAELHRVLARAVGVDDDDGLSEEDSTCLVLELLRWGNRVPWAQNWALLAGPRQRKELCSPTVLLPGDEDEYELVVSADDPEFLEKLKHGAETGVRVLITDTECADPSEEFLRLLDRYSSDPEHSDTSPRSGFHLVLSSSLPVLFLLEEIHPSILEKIKVIDLSLSTSETQHTILTNIIQSERPDLWTRHCQLKTDQQALQKQLHLQEASLMEYIIQTTTPLLQDSSSGFVTWVSRCLDSLQKLRAETEESNDINQHRSVISQFHSVAALVTNIYTALQDVGRLSPFYCFPLDRFLLVLRDTLAQMRRLGGTDSGVEITEMSHRIVAHYLAHYRPCLSQCHAEVLRLLVSTMSFTHSEGLATEAERTAFLLGIRYAVPPEPTPSLDQSDPELPSWVPEHIRADVRLLEKMPPFRGLCSSLRNSSRQWQQYLRFPSSTVVGPVPCETHSHLTVLQRAILWRTFFPQCLATVANDLATCQQGEPWSSEMGSGSHTGSLKQLSQFLSRNKGPVIVSLPDQSAAKCRGIRPLYWITELAHIHEKHGNRVNVKVITFGSENQRDAVLSELDLAVRTGHWLVLNNCHLLDRWDEDVVAQLRRLMSCRSEDPETSEQDGPAGGRAVDKVHPRFRLWFITKSSAACSVPAVLRVCALHLVGVSDQDLQDGLFSSLRLVLPGTLTDSSSGLSMSAAEPHIRCAILHSVLLQRQQMAQWAHGHLYHWTQEDLLALVDAQVHMAELCSDPTEALEYIAANLIYGGHVSDWSDLEEVKAVCRLCLQPSPPTQGIGPHMLSESVTAGYFGEEDLMKVLERRVHSALSSTGTAVVGFSAAVMGEVVKVKSLWLQALLLQSHPVSVGVSGQVVSSRLQSSLQGCRKSRDRLQALRNRLSCSEEGGGTGFGFIPAGPLSKFLRTELEQLMEQVSKYLSSSSYPTPSTVWALETQAELLRAYQWEESSGKHHVYCLSAFSNARGFLAALLRENARLRQQELSSISLHFQVLDSAASVPSSGICISGLELRGALWDTRLGVLQDSLSPNPCPLPLLWVRTLEQDLLKTSRSQAVYNCPLYLDVQDPGDDWSLTEEHIITHVPLRTRLDPVLCTLRRVRLVSTLSVNRFQY